MNTLYVIAVPIGNLKDITLLAIEKLTNLKVIFCEDTRVTKKLLTNLNIDLNKEFFCINQFNESEQYEEVLKKLEINDCALVSDAGYPIISDPGYFLVKKLRKQNIKVQVINGPCAFIHAIVGSGIDCRKVFYANFLSKKTEKRKSQLRELIPILKISTVVFYEPKNFLIYGLKIMLNVYGDIEICVARELTKLHETFYYGKISKIIEDVNQVGEFVIIIPRFDEEEEIKTIDTILEKIHFLVDKKNLPLTSAIKVYKNKEFNSSLLYKEYISKYK